jgi:hypothetical protein
MHETANVEVIQWFYPVLPYSVMPTMFLQASNQETNQYGTN